MAGIAISCRVHVVCVMTLSVSMHVGHKLASDLRTHARTHPHTHWDMSVCLPKLASNLPPLPPSNTCTH
jgi:hypothetical protein